MELLVHRLAQAFPWPILPVIGRPEYRDRGRPYRTRYMERRAVIRDDKRRAFYYPRQLAQVRHARQRDGIIPHLYKDPFADLFIGIIAYERYFHFIGVDKYITDLCESFFIPSLNMAFRAGTHGDKLIRIIYPFGTKEPCRSLPVISTYPYRIRSAARVPGLRQMLVYLMADLFCRLIHRLVAESRLYEEPEEAVAQVN